ncbi:MAG: DUF4436 family protein [Actinomycetes bacterium]
MSGPTPELIPLPRPISRRGGWALAVFGIVFAILYAVVVHFYNAEGGNLSQSQLGETAVPGIIVTIDPVDLNAEKDRVSLNVSLSSQGSGITDADNKLIHATRILVTSSLGTQEVKYAAGEPLGKFESVIGIDGEQALYPFDSHLGIIGISAESYALNSSAALTSLGEVKIGLQPGGGVSGWDTVNSYPEAMDVSAEGSLSFSRSFSTRVFAVLMLVLVVLLSGVALFIGCMVFTNRRKAEVGLMAWAGGVLFALPLLRNYLPYAPPVGAAIDIYVYLWAIVAAVSAVTVIVFAWLRQNRAVLEDAREKTNGS